jgi:hypothetical protein
MLAVVSFFSKIVSLPPDVKADVMKWYSLQYIPHCVLVDKDKKVVQNTGQFKATSVDAIRALL